MAATTVSCVTCFTVHPPDAECDLITREDIAAEPTWDIPLDPWPWLTDEQHAAKREQRAFESWTS